MFEINLAQQSEELNPVLESLQHNSLLSCLGYQKMPGAHLQQDAEAS